MRTRSTLADAPADFLNQLAEKTKLPRGIIVLGGGLFAAGLLWAVFGAGLLTNLVALAFPAYASFQAIESEGTEDDVQWLTYWIVYAVFSIPEAFADILEEYFTFYYPLKLAFSVWLFAPNTRGAEFLYNKFIRKYLLANEKRIDRVIEVASKIEAEAAKVVDDEAKLLADKAGKEAAESVEDFEKVEKEQEESGQ